jgi:hypothetical protein
MLDGIFNIQIKNVQSHSQADSVKTMSSQSTFQAPHCAIISIGYRILFLCLLGIWPNTFLALYLCSLSGSLITALRSTVQWCGVENWGRTTPVRSNPSLFCWGNSMLCPRSHCQRRQAVYVFQLVFLIKKRR